MDTSADPGAPTPTASVMSDAIDPPFSTRADWQRPGENRRQCRAIERRLGGGPAPLRRIIPVSEAPLRTPLQRSGGGRGVADSGREALEGSERDARIRATGHGRTIYRNTSGGRPRACLGGTYVSLPRTSRSISVSRSRRKIIGSGSRCRASPGARSEPPASTESLRGPPYPGAVAARYQTRQKRPPGALAAPRAWLPGGRAIAACRCAPTDLAAASKGSAVNRRQ